MSRPAAITPDVRDGREILLESLRDIGFVETTILGALTQSFRGLKSGGITSSTPRAVG